MGKVSNASSERLLAQTDSNVSADCRSRKHDVRVTAESIEWTDASCIALAISMDDSDCLTKIEDLRGEVV